MQHYEYRTVPAPARSEKAKGAKTPADRYAVTLTEAINRVAAEGWEYLRAETLPSEERSGLTGRTTLFHNLLIFRRPLTAAARPAGSAGDAASPAISTRNEAGAAQPEPAIAASGLAARSAPGPARGREAPVTPPAGDPETSLPTASIPAHDSRDRPTGSPVFSEKMRVTDKPRQPADRTDGAPATGESGGESSGSAASGSRDGGASSAD
ncbi:hypothetical protein SAMN05421538_10968 [Paracoccus isoporae]|uniref:DUF4177 domain-containing protein n=1 Tax=Paracoccus isoporae TaxID=591205 RepID=A0A1G7ET36_9RHOB|nr:DUF4177 domain-containing protein [Paracoccus isoporae]SDE66767.1 hypothetical protein SAMN05421538_10968 [Paracoccus isoporae]